MNMFGSLFKAEKQEIEMEVYAGLPARESRFNPTKKSMAMVRKSSAVNAGTIQKPWGW